MSKLARYLSVLCIWAIGTTARADLVIEITKGQSNATPIAVVPFGAEGAGAAPFDIAKVVSADLYRSGRFAPLDPRDMIEKPVSGEQIKFTDWKILKSDYLTVGKTLAEGPDRYTVQFELYSVLSGQRLLGQKFPGVAGAGLRATAHRIADLIFEQITGIPGAFSTRIAFVSAEGTIPNRKYKLLVADCDGENQQVIADSNYPLMSPAWSPDAQSLAYVSFEKKIAAIYVQALRTGERRLVSARAGTNNAPAWSPDGRKLAITLSPGGDLEIYILDLASQVPTRLTNDPSIDTEPVWSNDGQKIYFMSDRAGGPQIYEVSVDNPRQVRRLTREGNYNARPRVSPDGKKLAFMHREGGDDHIAVLDLATNALQVLTQGRDDESPSFAPNGALLIYATHDRGRGVLATVSIDGRVRTTLASSSGEVQEPVWSPYPPK